MSRRQLLFHELMQLIGPSDGSPWQLQVWDNDADQYVVLGGSGAGSNGSPLLAPGAAPLAAEMVVLPGDPPDPVTMGGDYVWLRRYQPNFTLSPDGDLTIVEGRD